MKILRFVPINLLFSLPMFGISMIVVHEVFKVALVPTIIISIIEYVYDVYAHSHIDYLQSQIDELKKDHDK